MGMRIGDLGLVAAREERLTEPQQGGGAEGVGATVGVGVRGWADNSLWSGGLEVDAGLEKGEWEMRCRCGSETRG